MPPRQVRSDQEDNGQDSTGVPAIQPNPGNTASQDVGTSPGRRLLNPLSTHPLPVIHEAEESNFHSQSLGLQGTILGTHPYSFPYLGNSNTETISNPFNAPFVSDRMYSIRPSNMNAMSRNLLPSSRITRNQGLGGSGTGARRPSQPQGQTGIAMNQAVTRAALGGMTGNQGQASNQGQFSAVDLTGGMDYGIGSPGSMDFYGSTMNSILDPNAFLSGGYDPFSSTGGGDVQQTPQGHGARDMSQIPKFDPELLAGSPDLISPVQYDSFGEDEHETKPDPRRLQQAEGTPTRAPRARRTPMALATNNINSPATPDANSPGDSAPEASISGGGASGSSSITARNNPQTHQAHVPPNRIAEAGPVTHPDPEFRPYGTNHWHVFLTEPTLLKYLSSTEIKDIREHCFDMAGKAAGSAGDPVPVAEGSPYTTADAQAVWKHCDAYIRRRSQVRNNQAARRSRMRKDAETRYWKALALRFGAPDHDFDWGLVDEDGNLPADIGAPVVVSTPTRAGTTTATEGGGAAQTRARARVQAARAHQQQQHGDGGQGQDGGGGGGQGGQADRRASASSGARPDFDFNQPLDFGMDDKTGVGNFDPFTGEF